MSAEKHIINMANKSKYIRKKKNRTVRKKPVVQPFCPPFMRRYDGCVNGFTTCWWCLGCLRVCLTASAATRHSSECKKKFAEIHKKRAVIPSTPK